MAVEGGFIQANTYSAEVLRRATIGLDVKRGASVGSVTGGIAASTDCQITAGSGMHVEVAAGEAIIAGSSSATQSGYYGRVTTTETLAIAASDPSNPRVDRVSLVVKDAAYTGAENVVVLAVETGTPTSGATLANLNGVAAAPTSSLTLGYVLVGAGVTSLTAEKIKNSAELLLPAMGAATYLEGTNASKPAAGSKGRIYYATDIKVYWVDTGSEWVQLSESHAHSVASAEQERANTSYGAFPTSIEAEVYVPENGVLEALFRGQWKQSVSEAGRIALFIGSNQLQAQVIAGQGGEAATLGTDLNFQTVTSFPGGLVSEEGLEHAEVTTGMALGFVHSGKAESGSEALTPAEGTAGTPVWIHGLPAGTYKVTVEAKSSSGNVKIKNANLRLRGRLF